MLRRREPAFPGAECPSPGETSLPGSVGAGPRSGPVGGGAAADPLLLPWLQAKDPRDADRLLGEILEAHARPLLRGILRRKLRSDAGGPAGSDVEDLLGEAILQVVSRLRDLREGRGDEPIRDFRAYVATAGYHAFYEHLRRKNPERFRLRNRLRYLLRHDPRFALWEASDGEWLAGAGEHRDAVPGREALAVVSDLRARPSLAGWAPPAGAEPGRPELAAMLVAVFRKAGAPVPFDDLMAIACSLLGISGAAAGPRFDDSAAEDAFAAFPDPAPGAETTLVQRDFLQGVWEEIRLLPPRQRAALLLNLRESSGKSALAFFPIAGVAGIRQIAEALEMPAERLAAMWTGLPLEDQAIGGLLGATRQQVINLRKCARERLARRMESRGKGRGDGPPGGNPRAVPPS